MEGGLALMWKQVDSINIVSSSQNYIDAEINVESVVLWRLTGFYGFPKRTRRRDSWELIKSLAETSSLSSVILGDFNDLLRKGEKRGLHKH